MKTKTVHVYMVPALLSLIMCCNFMDTEPANSFNGLWMIQKARHSIVDSIYENDSTFFYSNLERFIEFSGMQYSRYQLSEDS